MTLSRRDFVARAGAVTLAGSAVACASTSAHKAEQKKRKVLFLGGTGFLGPHTVRTLLDRGYEVTLFNRGQRGDDLFPELETIVGNRIVGVDQGLDPLKAEIDKGRTWDAVIDTANVHTWVENSASLLSGAAGQYLFTSSMSVYADNSEIGITEGDSELATMPDEEADKIDRLPYNMQYFGGVKVRCEQAAERHFPGRTSVVRPGLIVGPRDFSNRFTYWPWRIRQGGEVLAPGEPDTTVMFIDVRDVAEFMVTLIDKRLYETYNVNGPVSRDMTMGRLLKTCKETTGSDATFTWADGGWLAERGVNNWAQMPVWINPVDAMKGFHSKSTAKAIAAGLTTRPLPTTIKDTLAWFDDEYLPRLEENGQSYEPGVRAPGISMDREAELLKEWNEREG